MNKYVYFDGLFLRYKNSGLDVLMVFTSALFYMIVFMLVFKKI